MLPVLYINCNAISTRGLDSKQKVIHSIYIGGKDAVTVEVKVEKLATDRQMPETRSCD